MIFYTNSNEPGQIHELDERSPRLDALDNWTAHDTREAAEQASPAHRPGLVVRDGVLHRDGMAPRRPTIVAPDDETPDPLVVITPPGETPTEPGQPVRPRDSGSKSDWVAYAVARGADPVEADALTRDQLVAKYGGAT